MTPESFAKDAVSFANGQPSLTAPIGPEAEETSPTDSVIYPHYAVNPLTFEMSGPIFSGTQRRRLSHSVRFPSQRPVGST